MSQYQVTATIKGYIAAIVFVDAASAADAIDSAKMDISSRFDKIRAEVVGGNVEDFEPADGLTPCT